MRIWNLRVSALLTAGLLLLGCGADPSAFLPDQQDAAPSADAGVRLDAGPAPVVETRTCYPPRGMSGSPNTIFEALALINALPRPVTIPCFLEALDRPLRVNATSSFISAQPAAGKRSPRLFLFSGKDLLLSVVPEGTGGPLLELGQLTSATRSIKAEIKFPVTETLDRGAPFEHLHRPTGVVTACGFCHPSEEPVFDLPGAVESGALRPSPRFNVPLEDVRAEHKACDPEKEPARCAFFKALFENGAVNAHEFPAEMPVFF